MCKSNEGCVIIKIIQKIWVDTLRFAERSGEIGPVRNREQSINRLHSYRPYDRVAKQTSRPSGSRRDSNSNQYPNHNPNHNTNPNLNPNTAQAPAATLM